MKRMKRILVLGGLWGSLSPLGWAQSPQQDGQKPKIISREARSSRDQTKIDFDAVDISGARKAPMGSTIQQSMPDQDYDFVKIRLRWHPEMIQSASSLK